ncbi:DNA repair and recombination protein RAD26 [Drechslerella dactyloides]|uniref:DNA repair and recombination protein RAD26 n=1 Tax=Drechslerella dactyloides TaxID=74499 RepID=A0AAD6NIA0_DREDA|nr:DNA repair and recombination protein RAD26 [Drechslerella dactyloides]
MDEDLNIEEELGLQAFTHESLEGKVAEKAEAEMLEQEAKQSTKLKEKEASSIRKLEQDVKGLESLIRSSFGPKKAKYEEKLAEAKAKIEVHKANIVDIELRLRASAAKAAASVESSASRDQRKGESRRDYLIRKGIINPFSKEGQEVEEVEEGELPSSSPTEGPSQLSFQNLRAPGFATDEPVKPTGLKRQRTAKDRAVVTLPDLRPPSPARKTPTPADQKVAGFEDDYEQARAPRLRKAAQKLAVQQAEADSPEAETPDEESDAYRDEGEISEPEDAVEEEEEQRPSATSKRGKAKKATKKRARSDESSAAEEEDLREFDDGYEHVYQKRIKEWCAKRSAARGAEEKGDEGAPEWFKPSPSSPDLVIDEGFKLPGDIGQSLFDYQRTAVNWLWELHAKQHTGGILGDEMGLGKTIQAIAFIAGLHYSKLLTKPVLIVAPATVLRQWCNEFHKWWPPLRVSILHSSGSGMLSIASDKQAGQELDDEEDILEALEKRAPTKAQKAAKKIVDKVKSKGHVLISTYTGLTTYQKLLLDTEWECVVLDEGHRIRNPEAKITMAAKQLRSPTRFILSGTPIQNNLKELWSLFDFVYPGKLGVYGVFNEHIATPIKLGAYAGASNLQIHAAYKCAVVLREMIGPYILRRLKADVAVLPPKQDQVLFCNLVKQQKEAYEQYIKSTEVALIWDGRRDMLAGIDVLRKICNHPDLCNRDKLSADPKYNYGNPIKSGKMQIVKGLLNAWDKDKLKCLIFSQGTQMLDILEKFVKNLGYSYMRMDGGTEIKTRQAMVDRFNTDQTLQVFLLTTKVGGYGLNLTGATRIIIFDPDWNPSNDMQARERSWRLGQKHEVRIYRLLSRGTIEEKIYQRQLYKQFLTKKILEDPEQRRVFKMDDMQDLFTLGTVEHGTETGGLFEGVERTLSAAKQITEDNQSKQVEAIAGVDRLENFVGGASNMLSGSMSGNSAESKTESPSKDNEKGKGAKKDKGIPKDDHLLDSILAKAGVHSIVQHDAIMSTSKSSSDVIEREANRVAAEAKEALKRSFDNIKKYSVTGTAKATWTGKRTAAGTSRPGGMLTRTQMEPVFLQSNVVEEAGSRLQGDKGGKQGESSKAAGNDKKENISKKRKHDDDEEEAPKKRFKEDGVSEQNLSEKRKSDSAIEAETPKKRLKDGGSQEQAISKKRKHNEVDQKQGQSKDGSDDGRRIKRRLVRYRTNDQGKRVEHRRKRRKDPDDEKISSMR